jgi:hypothetical protein
LRGRIGPGKPGIGFQNIASAAAVVGDVMLVGILDAEDMGCEYWYVPIDMLVL